MSLASSFTVATGRVQGCGVRVNDSAAVPLSPPRVPLAGTLQRPPAEVAARFRSLKTPADVAELLELPWSQLHYITSRRTDLYPYRAFDIPKKGGGSRRIQSPHPTVRILQRKLLQALALVYTPHPSAHGFIRNRSIVTNASRHSGARLVLNVDLENFFPSVEFSRVRGVFIKRFKFPANVATILARICCNTGDFPDHLPQGGPTSPIITNMLCHSMDRQITRLAKRYGLFYTRYADDLTISTRRRTFPSQVAHVADGDLVSIGSEFLDIIERSGFELNSRKSRISTHSERLAVTGLTVNQFPNITRDYIRTIRGITHSWRAHGVDAAQARYLEAYDTSSNQADFRDVLAGHLAFVRSVRGKDDRLYRRLYDGAHQLDSLRFPALPEMSPRATSLAEAARDFPAINPTDSRMLRRQYLRRCAASARGTLWVIDPDLTIGVIEQIGNAASDLQVKILRFLSHDWAKAKAKDVQRFDAVVKALSAQGIHAEWRLLAPRKQFHDRWIGDDSDWITMGPIAAVDAPNPAYSQNHLGKRPPSLDQWWTQAIPVAAGRPPAKGAARP